VGAGGGVAREQPQPVPKAVRHDLGRLRERMLLPIYRLVWTSPERRTRKLLQFAEVESDGGRDLVRAAELTHDPILRRRFLAHARDEARHAQAFRVRGLALRGDLVQRATSSAIDWFAPGERGLDDVRVEMETDGALLAFLHLSEAAAARDFGIYRSALAHDPETRSVFERILRDEEFHMRYTLAELDRIAPESRRWLIWQARLRRLWKAYLRLATALAGAFAAVILTIQYFVLLPPFAILAKRAARGERVGWVKRAAAEPSS
jgi:rubrerythrin